MAQDGRKIKTSNSAAGTAILLTLTALGIFYFQNSEMHVDAKSVDVFLQRYGSLAIPALILLGNLGAPVPAETTALLAGFAARRGDIAYSEVVLLCTLSAIAGDSIGFLLGRRGGRPLVIRYGKRIGITQERFMSYEGFFAKYGARTVFIARFIAGLRFMAGPLAGASRMSFRRFLLANALGAIAWVLIMTQIGFHFGPSILSVLSHVQLAVLVIALLVLALFIKRHALK